MLNLVYTRYIAASVISLGVDFAVFMAALTLGAPPAIAAATGYIAGIICHWAISSRFVFAGQMAATASGRQQQQALFVLSALVGLGLTTGIVGIGIGVCLGVCLQHRRGIPVQAPQGVDQLGGGRMAREPVRNHRLLLGRTLTSQVTVEKREIECWRRHECV